MTTQQIRGNIQIIGGTVAVLDEENTFAESNTFNKELVVNGNAYSNGSLLVTDALSNGSVYGRKDGTWVTISGVFGANVTQIDQSGGTSDTYGILSGAVNSSNQVYTVSQGSYISGSLRVYLNGQLQTQGSSEDWTETSPAAGTFTFVTAPTTGDQITVAYMKSSATSGNADTLDGYHAASFAMDTYTVVTKSGDYTATAADDVILCTTTSGIIVTLPSATGSGRVFNIKSVNTGTVTVSGYSAQTIDGNNIKIIDTMYDNLTIVDGGSGAWYIL